MKDSIQTADSLVFAYPDSVSQTAGRSVYFDSVFSKQNLVEVPQKYAGIKISQRPEEMNMIFIVFVVCFLMTVFALTRGRQIIALMSGNLFHKKNRDSIFVATTGNDLLNRFLLFSQSVLMTAIITYGVFSVKNYDSGIEKSLLILAGFTGLILAYYLFKWIGYKFISYIFFDHSTYKHWISSWLSLISLSGLFIFFPVMAYFYVPVIRDISFYLLISWFIISRLIIIYKSYTIFFNNINSLHYLFLYLCAQEIIPLFLLYEGLGYFFNLVETNAL